MECTIPICEQNANDLMFVRNTLNNHKNMLKESMAQVALLVKCLEGAGVHNGVIRAILLEAQENALK